MGSCWRGRRHTDEVTSDGLDGLGADETGIVLAPLEVGGVSVGVPLVVVGAGASEEGRSGHDGCLHVSWWGD